MLAGSAICFAQAMRRTEFAKEPLGFFGRKLNARPLELARIPAIVLAVCIVVMAAAVLGWGVSANQYAGADFHGHVGVLLAATTFSSWLLSLVVFVASGIIAIGGVRPLWRSIRS